MKIKGLHAVVVKRPTRRSSGGRRISIPNRRELEREILDLGGTVRGLRRTGENMYEHPLMRGIKVGARRKTASEAAAAWVRRLKRKLEKETPAGLIFGGPDMIHADGTVEYKTVSWSLPQTLFVKQA